MIKHVTIIIAVLSAILGAWLISEIIESDLALDSSDLKSVNRTFVSDLYWLEVTEIGPTLNIANPDTQESRQIEIPKFSANSAFALDKVRGGVYFVDPKFGTIQYSSRDGSEYELLHQNREYIFDLEYDPYTSSIYWVEDDPTKTPGVTIFKSDTSKPSRVELVVNIRSALDIEIDPENQRLYWADGVLDTIMRSDLDGSDIEEFFSVPIPNGQQNSLANIALDIDNQRLFWSNLDINEVWQIDLNNRETFKSIISATGLGSFAISSEENSIYWLENGTSLWQSNLDAIEKKQIVILEESPFHLELDSEGSVYWNVSTGIMRLTRGSSEAIQMIYGFNVPHSILALDESLYWSDEKRILKSNLDGSNIKLVTNQVGLPTDLAADGEFEFLYWADKVARIGRVSIDTNEVKVLKEFPGAIVEHWGLALNSERNALYMSAQRFIYEIPGDRSDSTILIELEAEIHDVEFDSAEKFLFWSNKSNGRIGRYDVETGSSKIIVAGEKMPWGLALDEDQKKVFWADPQARKIRRANYDGSNVEDVFMDISAYAIAISKR